MREVSLITFILFKISIIKLISKFIYIFLIITWNVTPFPLLAESSIACQTAISNTQKLLIRTE